MKMVAATIIGGLLICGGALAGFFFALEIRQSNTSPALPEYLAITNVEYGVGPDGWIAVTVNNTGIAPVTIAKILVNNAKQSSVNPSLPITVAPDNGVVLNSTMNVTESEIYKTDLITSKGNMFSESSQVPAGGRQAGVRLYKANVSWDQDTHSKIYIDIGNSGTSDTQIILVYVGTSPSNLQNFTSPSFPLACNAGAAPVTININYNWTAAATYYFKVLSSSGQYIDTWAEQAPVS
jgi:hypothetical protein